MNIPEIAVLGPRLHGASSRTSLSAGSTVARASSEEELARDWILSESDRTEVLQYRGDDHRHRFAVQLCVLRQYGRFLEDTPDCQ